jgi:transcription elongation GreA/GreB family factor
MNDVVYAAPRRLITVTDHRRLRSLLESPLARRSIHSLRLRGLLVSAAVVASAQMPQDVVTMNSHVICRSARDRFVELELVYPWDQNGPSVSVLSEVGLALLGNRIGARITVAGETWGLTRLLYQPEEAGDCHL